MGADTYTLTVIHHYPSPSSKPSALVEMTAPLEIVTAALHKLTEYPKYGIDSIEVRRA